MSPPREDDHGRTHRDSRDSGRRFDSYDNGDFDAERDVPTRWPGRLSATASLSPVGPILRMAEAGFVRRDARERVQTASSSPGAPLPAELRAKLETSLGSDLSGVQLHTGPESAAAARSIQAKAYTLGQDVHFGAGNYDPVSASGQSLIAHEVAHTVQQRGAQSDVRQDKLEVSSPGDAHEVEAERFAETFAKGGDASIAPVSVGVIARAVIHRELERPREARAMVEELSRAPDREPETVRDVAASGVQGASSPLPHLDQIQSSFGHHDVGGIRAQVGGAAAMANEKMGAEAYATGSSIAFHGAPSLHTAAHEAAHTIQQRSGSVAGGMGQVGDAHERHADAVADAVVQGHDAEGILDQLGGAGGSDGAAMQLLAIQYQRPVPTPIDGAMSSLCDNIMLGGDAFGHSDWKRGVNWHGLHDWLNVVEVNETRLRETVNPTMDRDLAAVEQIRDEYKLKLTDAFEAEKAHIEDIVKNDTEVRTAIEEIRKTGASLTAKFTEKSAALTDVDASMNEMVAAVASQQKQDAEKDEKKQQANLASVNADKAKALAELMEIPELIKGAIDLGKEVAKEGPQAVAIAKAKGLGEKLIMEAYKGWAEKTVADQFDVTISNIQFKIRNIQTQIGQLQDKEAAARISAASGRAKAAAARVKAANLEIVNLAKHIEATRKTLSITIEKKYKDVTVFKLGHQATEAMRTPLATYLIDLNESKKCLAAFAPWQTWYGQLNGIALKAMGLDFLQGGPMPSIGDPAVTRRTPAEQANIDRTVATVNQFTMWLARFGNYVESEQAFVDAETEKVQSGGYLDFIQEIDAKIVGML